ncbi:hypothetical protein Dvina_51015 [Dactylosporangium vinaceum]|uniref:DUF222 domain-containing protein n=1 Tax=Dactylosporangium vinaceum TaxID=53362 RepID=A0ABV5M4E8_9ACTN|nr:hypothetical protein [Dactylosporangium vinaceum]UAB96186.1 hypothetical protein Dvina_51015 [Dactylosporangium vinaceum]
MLTTLFTDAPGDDGIADALAAAGAVDDGLLHGFARIDEDRAAALSALAGAFAGSPLREPVAEAVDKIVAGSVADDHLFALAAARIALFGAVHDALLARADAALGRTRAEWLGEPGPAAAATHLLGGARSWLRELAITGWRGVDHDLVAAAGQAVEAALAEPELRRLAVLLDGLAAELRAGSPIATMAHVPIRRWADLWSRALLLARDGGRAQKAAQAEPVTGRLFPLGVDVHEHPTAVQVQVHGVLEAGGATRLVRASVSAAKVDTIVGPAIWRLLSGHPMLLTALAEHRALDVTDMPLLAGGDLIWRDAQARPGDEADPFTTARVHLATAVAPATPPLERHPARIAEPVLVEDVSAITLDTTRLPACGPLTPATVRAATACIGLLRWDDGAWTVQPLGVQATVKKKAVAAHTADWALGPTDAKLAKAAGEAVEVLRERAGRLLRK